jgi:hypothetical protein
MLRPIFNPHQEQEKIPQIATNHFYCQKTKSELLELIYSK